MMRKRAQTTMEYAVLVVCIIAALLAMQIYLKRSLQGHFKGAAESIGQQYAPKHTTGDYNITIYANSTTTVEVTDDEANYRTNTNTTTTSYSNETNQGSTSVGSLAGESLF